MEVIPDIANPLNPTAAIRDAIAVVGSLVNPTMSRNVASKPKPRNNTL